MGSICSKWENQRSLQPSIRIIMYAIDVFTDSPGGWKASVTEGSDWLTFEGAATTASGIANEDTKLTLRLPYYKNEIIGGTRTATVTLVAGRLTHEIR